jgi:DNA-directed RNA polymerase subunit M/transcription elongation factor TFIIS
MLPFIKDVDYVLKCHVCENEESTRRENIIYKNEKTIIKNIDASVYKNMTLDPTLPRTTKISCKECDQNEVVFFPQPVTSKLQYICCKCVHVWIC